MNDWIAWWLGWSWQPEAFRILMGDLKLLTDGAPSDRKLRRGPTPRGNHRVGPPEADRVRRRKDRRVGRSFWKKYGEGGGTPSEPPRIRSLAGTTPAALPQTTDFHFSSGGSSG